MTTEIYMGIDVSKAKLDVADHNRHLMTVPNTPAGWKKIIQRCQKLNPSIIAIEATGGYERLLSFALFDASFPVAIVQPGCVRHFALSRKVLAKTDAIDSVSIAQFAQSNQPRLSKKPSEKDRKLRALRDRRAHVVEDRVREHNRLEACSCDEIADAIEHSITRLQEEEERLDTAIRDCIHSCALLQQKNEMLMKQKGVGAQTAVTLLTHLTEIGSVNRQQIAALAGLAPYDRASGNWKGRSSIYGGRADVRKALFFAALSASQFDASMKCYYQSLLRKGKVKKVALIACARKLLVRLNTQARELQENPSSFS